MINKIQLRGQGVNSLKSSIKYVMKYTDDEQNGGPFLSSLSKKSTTSVKQYAEIFERKIEKLRQKNQKNTYAFCSLSFSHADSKKLTDEEALEIAKQFYLEDAFPGDRHFILTVENDKEHKHVHAIIALTDFKTKKVFNKFVDFQPICSKFEAKYNLEKLERSTAKKPSPFSTAPNTRKMEQRKDEKAIKNDIKENVSLAFLEAATFNEFLESLQENEISLIPTMNSGGLCGLCFEKNGEIFKGSQIGYSAKLIKEKYEKTKGFKSYVDFCKANRKEINETKSLITDKADVNKKIFLGKNFEDLGDKVIYKETKKVAYYRKENSIQFETSNLKNVSQAVKEMKQRNKDCCLNVKSENENFKRNVWIACVQNQVDFVKDLYTPNAKDYEIAIKNCFNEEAKQKLIEEYKSKFEEEKKEKRKIKYT
ncbi:TPA: relaxase/mobilization nuclease domain-containing protein [Pseudomonas aeruginosa]|nr:relaxase/mobilization nuclease domain-containing protein [Pseudomonas aeruginosa]